MDRVEVDRRRLWLVFFSNGSPAWYDRLLPDGFRHVSAAAYFADQERWVYLDPARGSLVVEVCRPDEFTGRLGQLTEDAHAIVRMPSAAARQRAPVGWYCVGAVKALLGIGGRALSPAGLYRQLVDLKAEIIKADGKFVQSAEAPGRGSEREDAPRSGATAGGA